jgi:hypothetical protein
VISGFDVSWVSGLLKTLREAFDISLRDALRDLLRDASQKDLDEIRRPLARLFDRERAVIRAREHTAKQRSDHAIGVGLGGLGLLIAITTGFTLYLRGLDRAPRPRVAHHTP